jgi:hypothetical protein
MANIQERAGAVHVRIGGNTQEYAYYVDTLPQGRAISKEKANTNNPVGSFRQASFLVTQYLGRRKHRP